VTVVDESSALVRSTLTITGWNAVSRVTGFVRVLAVGAALGTTFLGNTYQSSNLVSNLLFELLAAGLLSAPLVPAFVGLLDAGRPEDADRLAGNLLGLALVGLGAAVLMLAVAGHAVMRLLTIGVADPGLRAQEVRLGAFFLWFFLPQALLYCVGAVASALLNAERRFAAVAFAPVANNVMVTATMIVYVALRHGARPELSLPASHRLVLAVGTTGGVLAMTAVPLLAMWRRGRRPRLGLSVSDPYVRGVARIGAWGGVLLAGTQALIAVTLVLANRVEGGVVAYQIAFTFYLLPFAMVAHPIFTALYPRLSAHAHADRWDEFADDLRSAVRRTAALLLPASLALAGLAAPALQLVRLGALNQAGVSLTARVLAAYAAGLVGYAVFQLLARAATATGDARLPAVVGLGVTALGAALMIVGSHVGRGDNRVVFLGLAHSVAMLAGALALGLLLRRRLAPSLSRSCTPNVTFATKNGTA
jgi:putative peptidoglycan lipid II flippase